LYLVNPRSFLISIGGQRFDHGEGLSPEAVNALPQSVAAVDGILRRLNVPGGLCKGQ